jgi:hypothetical protein
MDYHDNPPMLDLSVDVTVPSLLVFYGKTVTTKSGYLDKLDGKGTRKPATHPMDLLFMWNYILSYS